MDGRPRHVGARTQPPGTAAARIVLGKARYRPGEHVPVIIRSSRDFMGFLLQARSVPTPRVSGDSGPGDVRLVGTFTHRPAGTHLLRCPAWGQPPGDAGQPQLPQGGASVTHTDKSLKRNLSFVWRAPVDGAHGDVRFMASIVQSYFVFWSDVESPILRAHHDPSGDDSVQNEIDLAADDGGGDGKGDGEADDGDDYTLLRGTTNASSLPVHQNLQASSPPTQRWGDEAKTTATVTMTTMMMVTTLMMTSPSTTGEVGEDSPRAVIELVTHKLGEATQTADVAEQGAAGGGPVEGGHLQEVPTLAWSDDEFTSGETPGGLTTGGTWPVEKSTVWISTRPASSPSSAAEIEAATVAASLSEVTITSPAAATTLTSSAEVAEVSSPSSSSLSATSTMSWSTLPESSPSASTELILPKEGMTQIGAHNKAEVTSVTGPHGQRVTIANTLTASVMNNNSWSTTGSAVTQVTENTNDHELAAGGGHGDDLGGGGSASDDDADDDLSEAHGHSREGGRADGAPENEDDGIGRGDEEDVSIPFNVDVYDHRGDIDSGGRSNAYGDAKVVGHGEGGSDGDIDVGDDGDTLPHPQGNDEAARGDDSSNNPNDINTTESRDGEADGAAGAAIAAGSGNGAAAGHGGAAVDSDEAAGAADGRGAAGVGNGVAGGDDTAGGGATGGVDTAGGGGEATGGGGAADGGGGGAADGGGGATGGGGGAAGGGGGATGGGGGLLEVVVELLEVVVELLEVVVELLEVVVELLELLEVVMELLGLVVELLEVVMELLGLVVELLEVVVELLDVVVELLEVVVELLEVVVELLEVVVELLKVVMKLLMEVVELLELLIEVELLALLMEVVVDLLQVMVELLLEELLEVVLEVTEMLDQPCLPRMPWESRPSCVSSSRLSPSSSSGDVYTGGDG
ncbi:uncharacterized protein LOC144718575 [Lampetra planeri]